MENLSLSLGLMTLGVASPAPDYSPCPAAKESFGVSRSPPTASRYGYQLPAYGSAVNLNAETQDSYTGNLFVPSVRRNLLPELERCSDPTMPNYPVPKLPPGMSGRMSPASPTPASSLGSCPYDEMHPSTGKEFGISLRMGTYLPYPHQFVYKVTGLSVRSAQTMRNRLEWSDLVTVSGVELNLGNRGMLGQQPVSTLTLKIPARSSGVDTWIRAVWSLMNFEEVSMSATSSDGWIVIRSLWRKRDLQSV